LKARYEGATQIFVTGVFVIVAVTIFACVAIDMLSASPAHGGYPCPCCVPHTYEVPAGADLTHPMVEVYRVQAQVAVDEAREQCIASGEVGYDIWGAEVAICNAKYGQGTAWWFFDEWQQCNELALVNLGHFLSPINNAYESEWVAIQLQYDYLILSL
jgi:hypothetical protein